MNIDGELFKEAKAARGAETDTETVRLGLEAPVRHAAYQIGLRMAHLPSLEIVPKMKKGPSGESLGPFF